MADASESTQFQPGNQFWRARSTHGRRPKFARTAKGAEKLWSACCEYFDWVEANPLIGAQLVTFQGAGTIAEVPHRRAMTLEGLCDFIDVDPSTWHGWKGSGGLSRPDLIHVITRAERVIYRQKFEGAAAGLLNPNIIARDLGLADKKEVEGGFVVNINGRAADI